MGFGSSGGVLLASRRRSGVPVNTDPPSLSGVEQVGQQLTCSTGTWDPSADSYEYQWLRDGGDIGGEINNTYIIVIADAGTTVSCEVVATNGAGSSAPEESDGAPIIGLPSNIGAPVTSGVFELGEEVSSTTGTWTNSPFSYDYQWTRGGGNIGGATSNQYTIVAADRGTWLACKVRAENTSGWSGFTWSSDDYILDLPVNQTPPAFTGTEEVGNTLTITDTGAWSESPTTWQYAWYRDGSPIGGETNNNYLIDIADAGTTITCRVWASNSSGQSATYTNTNGAPIIALPVGLGDPAFTGTEEVGNTLTITDTGTWSNSPSSYNYQWYRGASPISGETNNNYLIDIADAGTTITCRVWGVNSSGPAVDYRATNGAPIIALPVNTDAPLLSGVEEVGNQLSCSSGTWSNSPSSYNYQWYRDTNAIGGETNNNYLIDIADAGTTLTCRVWGVNSSGPSVTYEPSDGAPIIGLPVMVSPPVISGVLVVGQTLSGTDGTWQNSPTNFTYRWGNEDDGFHPGETGSTYDVRAADDSWHVIFEVTASNSSGPGTPAEVESDGTVSGGN